MPEVSYSSRVHTAAHWGAYDALIQDDQFVGTQPFADDPNPSSIVEAMVDAVYHPSRITRPMVRQGFLEKGQQSDRSQRGREPFVAVSWEQALDLIAAELQRVQTDYGNDAIYASSGWGSAGIFHSAASQLFRFLNGFGGYVNQVTNYSFGAASVLVPRIVGTMQPVVGPHTAWPVICEHTDLMVMFGGMAPKNTQVNLGGVGRHDAQGWLNRIRQSGTEFINISPMRSDAEETLDADWLPIRPNSDTALMLGLAHTLLVEGLHDTDFLGQYCVGFERFRDYLLGTTDQQPKDAAWASRLTDIPATTIQPLARRMAKGRTMITVSWSIQRADHGEQPYWAAITLAAMLGQIGLPGGGFGFGYGASAGLGSPVSGVRIPSLPTGDNPIQTFIPMARFADMLLSPGGAYEFNGQQLTYPDIRLMYWCGGNPFHKVQDLNQLLLAWQKPETIIIHDPWWTPAARRADIVLPCATTLERNDLGATSIDRYVFAMQRAIEPVGESRTEYEIYTALAQRLGFQARFTENRSESDWLRHLYELMRQSDTDNRYELPEFDAFWESGHIAFPPAETPTVLFDAFRRDPDAHPLKTPSGRIEIFSDTIDRFGYDDCPGHAAWLEPAEWLGGGDTERYPLHLLSNQPRARLHSQLDCSLVSQQDKVKQREAIRLHPDDAMARGIATGDVVRVYNDRGACLAGAVVTDAVRPGVVVMATGAWFDPDQEGETKPQDKHGNPNVLTRDAGTSRLAQSCSAQTALVELERVQGEIPAITAFTPPLVALT